MIAAPPSASDHGDLEALDAARARITPVTAALGRDELRVIELVVDGLARGRRQYGELRAARDPRDFIAEARDEARDGLVYLAAHLIRLERREAST